MTSRHAIQAPRKAISVLMSMALAGTCSLGVLAVDAAQPADQMQQAQAASRSKAVSKVYKKALAKKRWKWANPSSETTESSQLRFAVADVNGDGTKELFVRNDWSDRMYTLEGKKLKNLTKNVGVAGLGKVIGVTGFGKATVYKKGKTMRAVEYHGGGQWDRYYKIKNGKLVCVAEHYFVQGLSGSDVYSLGSKVISAGTFKRAVKGYTKGKKGVKVRYHKNTANNRSKYLK